jgi:hypothetical protein
MDEGTVNEFSSREEFRSEHSRRTGARGWEPAPPGTLGATAQLGLHSSGARRSSRNAKTWRRSPRRTVKIGDGASTFVRSETIEGRRGSAANPDHGATFHFARPGMP